MVSPSFSMPETTSSSWTIVFKPTPKAKWVPFGALVFPILQLSHRNIISVPRLPTSKGSKTTFLAPKNGGWNDFRLLPPFPMRMRYEKSHSRLKSVRNLQLSLWAVVRRSGEPSLYSLAAKLALTGSTTTTAARLVNVNAETSLSVLLRSLHVEHYIYPQLFTTIRHNLSPHRYFQRYIRLHTHNCNYTLRLNYN